MTDDRRQTSIRLFVLVLVLVLDLASAQDSWPMFHGDPALSGVAQVKLSRKPKLAWTFKTGKKVLSSPVIQDGRVFVGSSDHKLYALDQKTGKQLWAFDVGDEIQAPPLVSNGTVYVGDFDGELHAFDAATGKPKWIAQTDDRIIGAANVATLSDGKTKLIIVGSYDYFLYGVDANTGKRAWRYESENFINGTPSVLNGRAVFGGCDALVHVVNVTNGAGVAKIEPGAYLAASVALFDNHAYVGDFDGQLSAIDLGRKKIVWKYMDDDAGGPFLSSPAVTKDVVVIGSQDERVHCVRRDNGKLLWTFKTSGSVDGSPLICKDRVVIGSDDGRLYLLDLATGKETWSYEIGDNIKSSPAVANGMIIVGANDGLIYAFR